METNSNIPSTCITEATNTAGIDYLSFTLPDAVPLDSTITTLFNVPFDSFKASTGRSGYRARYHHNGVTVLTDGGALGMGHNVTLTGRACFAGQNNLRQLASEVFQLGGRFTRCDLKIDDYQGFVEMPEVLESIRSGLVTAIFRRIRQYDEYDKRTGKLAGRAAYFGSRKSAVFIRIYDKALQQRDDYHCTRLELEVKGEKANAAVGLIMNQDIGHVLKGLLKSMVTFREHGKGVNRSRWPVAGWWQLFLGNVEGLRLSGALEDDGSQERRLIWFVSNAAMFTELVDLCGAGVVPVLYNAGKLRQIGKRGTR